MSRALGILAFWLLGFGIGFAGYLSLPAIADWFSTALPKFVNASIIGALFAGMIGSAISTFTVMTWANRTSV